MKLFVVVLALATVSQAFDRGETSDSRLTDVLHTFTEQLRKCAIALLDKWTTLENSEISQELQSQLRTIELKLNKRYKNWKQSSSPEALQASEQLNELMFRVIQKIVNSMEEMNRVGRSTVNALYEPLESLAEPILKGVEAYAKPLHSALISSVQELDAKWEEKLLAPLRSLGAELSPYIRGSPTFWASLEPHLDQMQEEGQHGLERARKHLQPHLAPFLKALQEHRQEVREWASAPIFPSEQ